MHVFLTGATGVLGGRLVDRLADRGHEVVGLVRDERGEALVEARGGVPHRGDVLDPASLDGAVAEADVAIHAATSLPVTRKPTEEDWTRNDRVRLEGSRNVVAAAEGRIERVVFPSVTWVARRPDGAPFDEGAERRPTRATRSAAATEEFLERAGETRGFDVTVLRCGFFYAPDAAHTRQFGEALLAGDLPVVGGGPFGRRDGTLSLLHVDDAAAAFAEALETGATGLYHVVDDDPVAPADLFAAFAAELGAPKPRRLPGWLAKFFVGEETASLLTASAPTASERFRRATGWEPSYPTYREGLRQVVETWTDDGTLRETADGYEWAGGSAAADGHSPSAERASSS